MQEIYLLFDIEYLYYTDVGNLMSADAYRNKCVSRRYGLFNLLVAIDSGVNILTVNTLNIKRPLNKLCVSIDFIESKKCIIYLFVYLICYTCYYIIILACISVIVIKFVRFK